MANSRRGRWHVALRYGARQARRSRGRSALIVVMVILPVAVAAFAAVMISSQQVTWNTTLARDIGPEATARVHYVSGVAVRQSADAKYDYPAGTDTGQAQDDSSPVAVTADAVRALPAKISATLGSGADVTSIYRFPRRLTAGDASVDGELTATTWTTATRALYAVKQGELPSVPGQIALSGEIADRLGIVSGQTITAVASQTFGTSVNVPDATYTVTGILSPTAGTRSVYPADAVTLSADAAQAAQEIASALTTQGQLYQGSGQYGLDWLVAGAPVDWGSVRALNEVGATAVSRAVDPAATLPGEADTSWQDQQTHTEQLWVLLILAIGLAQAILMVGPAFAVGAQRAERDLLTMAVNGADRRTLTAVTLGGGVVLGAVASLIGVALGVAGVLIGWAFAPGFVTNLVIPSQLLVVIAIAGIVMAAAAAWIPAMTAARRMSVAPSERPLKTARSRPSVLSWLGIALAAAGAGATSVGAVMASRYLLIIGVAALEVGLIMMISLIITAIATVARRLPTALRYAARDAARHMARTVPAVAAIVAATASMTAVAIHQHSMARFEVVARPWALPAGTIAAFVDGTEPPLSDSNIATIADAVRGQFPDAGATHALGIAMLDDQWQLAGWATPLSYDDDTSYPLGYSFVTSRPAVDNYFGPIPTSIAVDDGSSFDALAGEGECPGAAAALRSGKAVVPVGTVSPNGTASFTWSANSRSGDLNAPSDFEAESDVPAVECDAMGRGSVSAVIPPAVAKSQGASVERRIVVVQTGAAAVTSSQVEAIARAARSPANAGDAVDITVTADPGPNASADDEAVKGTWIMLGIAAALVLASAWISTSLSISESRPDLATMAAVGASPRLRRRVAAGQAGFIAVTGSVLGSAGGIILGVALTLADRAQYGPLMTVVIPWWQLGLAAAVVLATVIVLAAALTRSRMEMVRRIE
ncbi:FtsX-like permease family protein [Rarobacter incanus]|uniref:Putative ABC transport system permease protein n=1 Tax=Rarobacter incanus TaxID=153494 RepID=A0A542SPC8_9MICO|nr:FtsX-like permease family protein [Rarobacter incanus]TQK76474.1 putative ABC transport system permease protein [Rarobacter incanus]